MRDQKILFLIRTLNIGGAEHVLCDIVNRMAEDGYSITVQTLLDEGYYREKLSPRVTYKKGFSVHSVWSRRVIMKLLYRLPARFWGTLLICRGYTHLVAFVEDLPTKVIYGYPGHDAKKIAWIHTDLYTNQAAKGTFGTVEKSAACYPSFDQVVCVSRDAKEGFLKKVGNHHAIDVQHNPLDKAEIQRKAQAEPDYPVRDTDAFRLVAVGRLVRLKGFDLLIEAMARVRREANRTVELYIVGGGKEEAALREQIQSLHLEDCVFLCGQQTNPYSLMSRCDAQILSSRVEGYPLALCEGHFLGLPVVATKCTGSIEILEESCGGILVDISADALADGILKLTGDAAVYAHYRQNVRQWSENYCADRLYQQIEDRFQ